MKLTLARTVTCSAERCQVQLLDDSSVTDAPLSPRMIEIGTRVRPGMIVALDLSTTPPLIRWRFAVRPVEALAGDRLTLLGREHRFVDTRPEAERTTPLRVGDTVIFRFQGANDELEIFDTLVDGRPYHPEFLEAQFPQIEATYQSR